MRGSEPALADIAAEEDAAVLDLHCYESLESEEAEHTFYNVELHCTCCAKAIKLVVSANDSGIRDLALTLRERNLAFLCSACTKNFK
uniref:Protein E7 n=1 Tax=Eidolon bat papillomavirus TaxID=3141875 RepID=A0AAU7E300_9PAPI